MKRSVVTVIFNSEKDQVVLVRRRDVPFWALPGGGIDPGESPATAAIREAQEETGLQVSVVRQAAEYTPINRLANLTYCYECEVVKGTLETGPETKAVQFFPLHALPDSLFFIHRRWIEDALHEPNNTVYKKLDYINYVELFKYFLKHPICVLRLLMSRLGIPLNSK